MGYLIDTPDDNPNEIPRSQQAAAMGAPGYFNAGPLPAVSHAVFGDAPATRTYANSASFPEPSDPTGGPVTSLTYNPNFAATSGVGANPFSFVQTGRTDNPPLGNEGAGSLAQRGYPEAQIAVSPAEVRNAGQANAYNEGGGTLAQRGYLGADYGASQSVPVPQGPLSAAVAAPYQGGVLYNNPNEADYARQLKGYAAREQQDVQDRDNRQIAAAAAANAQSDLVGAKGNARVANWDRLMAQYDAAGNIGGEGRYAALESADKAAGVANAAVDTTQARLTSAQQGEQGKRNYLDDLEKEQKALAEGTKGVNARALSEAQIGEYKARAASENARAAGTGVSTAQQQQILDLRKQLAAETDPKKKLALQSQLYAIEGKVAQPKVAVIQVDTGAKDLMNQPIYKNAAINTETGELVGGNTAAAKSGQYPQVVPQAVEALKAGKVTPQQFDAFYGPGASTAALK